jgi:ubiquinone/menaquinone biosynthesis C-methylase UbiE
MKIRESGMPEETLWASFFDVPEILSTLKIDGNINDLVEIGCGYGTFTIPASETISGSLYGFDIEPDMVLNINTKTKEKNIKNIHLELKDVLTETTGLPPNSVDYVMLFNILHLEKPENLLLEAFRILKKGGLVGIIHWRSDIETPRGPSLDIRPKPHAIRLCLLSCGFEIELEPTNIGPYHFKHN